MQTYPYRPFPRRLRVGVATRGYGHKVTKPCSTNFPQNGSAPTVFSLDAAGNRTGEVPCQWESGILRFTVRTDLNPTSATFLYEIVRRDTDFPMAAGAASATTTNNETHGENHELHE